MKWRNTRTVFRDNWHSFFKWVYRQQEKVLFFLKYTHVSNYIVFAKGALKIEDCELKSRIWQSK